MSRPVTADVLAALVDKALALDCSAVQLARWTDKPLGAVTQALGKLRRDRLAVRVVREVPDPDRSEAFRRAPRWHATVAGIKALRRWQAKAGA